MVIAVARSSRTPGGYPPRVAHVDVYRESAHGGSITVVDRGDDFAVAEDLDLVDGLYRVPIYNHWHTGGGSRQCQYFVARWMVGHRQSQNGPVGAKAAATPQPVEPPIIGKISPNINIHPVTGTDEPVGTR